MISLRRVLARELVVLWESLVEMFGAARALADRALQAARRRYAEVSRG